MSLRAAVGAREERPRGEPLVNLVREEAGAGPQVRESALQATRP